LLKLLTERLFTIRSLFPDTETIARSRKSSIADTAKRIAARRWFARVSCFVLTFIVDIDCGKGIKGAYRGVNEDVAIKCGE